MTLMVSLAGPQASVLVQLLRELGSHKVKEKNNEAVCCDTVEVIK